MRREIISQKLTKDLFLWEIIIKYMYVHILGKINQAFLSL